MSNQQGNKKVIKYQYFLNLKTKETVRVSMDEPDTLDFYLSNPGYKHQTKGRDPKLRVVYPGAKHQVLLENKEGISQAFHKNSDDVDRYIRKGWKVISKGTPVKPVTNTNPGKSDADTRKDKAALARAQRKLDNGGTYDDLTPLEKVAYDNAG